MLETFRHGPLLLDDRAQVGMGFVVLVVTHSDQVSTSDQPTDEVVTGLVVFAVLGSQSFQVATVVRTVVVLELGSTQFPHPSEGSFVGPVQEPVVDLSQFCHDLAPLVTDVVQGLEAGVCQSTQPADAVEAPCLDFAPSGVQPYGPVSVTVTTSQAPFSACHHGLSSARTVVAETANKALSSWTEECIFNEK